MNKQTRIDLLYNLSINKALNYNKKYVFEDLKSYEKEVILNKLLKMKSKYLVKIINCKSSDFKIIKLGKATIYTSFVKTLNKEIQKLNKTIL